MCVPGSDVVATNRLRLVVVVIGPAFSVTIIALHVLLVCWTTAKARIIPSLPVGTRKLRFSLNFLHHRSICSDDQQLFCPIISIGVSLVDTIVLQ